MPRPSSAHFRHHPSGKDGWEVHFAAITRKQAGEDIIMLSVGDHDFDTPSETVEACVRAVRGGFHHYTQLPGIPRLREAMARLDPLHRRGDAPAQVIATPGGQAALYAAVQGVLDPGGHAIVVAPYYATYPGTFRAAGAGFTVVEARAEDGFQPRAEAIAKALQPNTRAILVNTPNNPTGAVYSPHSARRARRHLPPARSLAALRRGLLDARRRRASVAARPARHGRAHSGHQLDVEEPRHDRLAHRLADRPARPHRRCRSTSTWSPPTA